MIFYQATLPEVSIELIEDCILKKVPVTESIQFYFHGYPDLHTLTDYLKIVDEKRKTLKNPYKRSFISLEIEHTIDFTLDELISISTKITDAINIAFSNDLFICSYIYKDIYNIIHSLIVISDIERSLPEPTLRRLKYDDLYRIIYTILPEYYIDDLVQSALYAFSNEEDTIAYDGVINLDCCIEHKPNIPTYQ